MLTDSRKIENEELKGKGEKPKATGSHGPVRIRESEKPLPSTYGKNQNLHGDGPEASSLTLGLTCGLAAVQYSERWDQIMPLSQH